MKNWKTSAEAILTTGPVVPVIVVTNWSTPSQWRRRWWRWRSCFSEVTLRLPATGRDLRYRQRSAGRVIIGAGTVLNAQQLAEVTEAGAQFAISPGLMSPC
ncbi:hypothetical protein ACNKHS_10975 [Shigella flexneri]